MLVKLQQDHDMHNTSNIKTDSTAILKKYAQLLIKNIKTHGFVPELLNLSQTADFSSTRALCQTRSIFYLVIIHQLSADDSYLKYALLLQQQLKHHYFDQSACDWRQYPNGKIMDNLYEYAFLLFGYSHLYKAHEKQDFINEIKALYTVVDGKFITNDFAILRDNNGVLCQNALMHLFEALLAAFEATKFSLYKTAAEKLYQKILTWFYHPEKRLIAEYSGHNNIYEPGHSFEWACLIYHARKLGLTLPETPSFQEIATSAEKYGISDNNLVKPEITSDTQAVQYRIWPMLERLRYYAITEDANQANQVLATLHQFFIARQLPVEYVDYQGTSQFNNIKSTTGYHLINALRYYVNDMK